jgi:diguanylate cyclase (GGDEF)-like protein/PAS domain S-box-containing protein
MRLAPSDPRQKVFLSAQADAAMVSGASSTLESCPPAAIDLAVSPVENSAEELAGTSASVRVIAGNCLAEVALPHLEEEYRLLFDSNPVPMWVFDRETFRFIAVNEAAIRQYGFTRQEFLAKSITEIRPEEEIPGLLLDVAKRTVGLENCGLWRHRKKSGEILDVEIASHPLDFRGIASMLVAAQDVTARKRAEDAVRRAEEKYRDIFENAVIGIFQATPSGRLTSINNALAQMHGYESPEEIMAEVSNVALDIFVDPGRLAELTAAVTRNGVVLGAEVEIYRRDRTTKWVRVNVRGIRDANGNIALFEGTVEDITEHKAVQERVKFLAYYDALTELPHRALLQDRLDNALVGARRRGEQIALLFLDLDRFKAINDSYGHAFGDRVLKEVAKRLKECAREHNTVARVGGDEFLILLSNINDAADAAIVAERVMDAMNASFAVEGRSLSLGCSVGVSIFPEHGEDGETLIRHADAAMYSAKEGGRSTIRFFTDEMNAQAMERLTMDKDLRLALAREEFFLAYQPQREIESGRITAFEALIRWRHPVLGLVPPDRFISIAENSGLILPIGEWVLRTACAQARRWQDDGLPAVAVAVNVSAVQFRQEGFRTLIRRVLNETGLAPQYLELELTESLLLSNADVTLSVLQELKEMGLKLCIDDFGTGYSSLSYLRHFSVDKLKIDQSFVREIVVNRDDAAITTAIINMAKSLHIKVIAEGVENKAQMNFLRNRRCDEIQGYYFSKPISAEEAASLLRCEQGHWTVAERQVPARHPTLRYRVSG